MYKFFVAQDQIDGENIKIIGEDVNHIVNVLRLMLEDQIIVCNKENQDKYIASIISEDKDSVCCKIVEKDLISTESTVSVDIYQGLPKADKMEFIIQKATELGVKNIFPVAMERCVVKLDEKTKNKKLERWNKIAEVAAKQSKRDVIPQVEDIVNIENICQKVPKYDIILLAYENEKSNTIKTELEKLDKTKNLQIGVVIGPEGGLSEEEVQRLIDSGAKCITLGKRILRTETASLVILSDITYEFEL